MIELSVHERGLRDLARACRKESDGKEIRKDLIREMRGALNPARQDVRASIRSMPSQGVRHAGPKLRVAVAQKVIVLIKPGSKAPGARLVAKKTKSVRDFAHAPRRLNSRKGWHHAIFGGPEIVHQIGKPGWFDDPIKARYPQFRKA